MFVTGTRRKPKTLILNVKKKSTKPKIEIKKAKGNIQINFKGKKVKNNEVEKHQHNIKEILLNSNASPIRCKGGIGYTCCFCTEQFRNPSDLKTHTTVAHFDELADFMKGKDMHGYFVKLDITDLQCTLCDLKINSTESLMEHLQESHCKTIYTDIKNHILPFKFDTEALVCFMCYNVFNSFKALQEHMNAHYKNFICEECGAGFVNKNILLRHKDAHKTGSFECEKCLKIFDTVRKRRLHMRSIHNTDKLPHKCGYCDERFKEVWKKNEHLAKVHGIRGPGIKCQACEKTFETKNSWRLHTTRVHLLQRPHQCKHCEMEFYAKKELESHMVKHTGTREFSCVYCGKTYGRHKTLKEHLRRIHHAYQKVGK